MKQLEETDEVKRTEDKYNAEAEENPWKEIRQIKKKIEEQKKREKNNSQ